MGKISLFELLNARYVPALIHDDTWSLRKELWSANSVVIATLCFELIKPDTVDPCVCSKRTFVARTTSSFTSNTSVDVCFCHVAATLAFPPRTPARGVVCNSLFF